MKKQLTLIDPKNISEKELYSFSVQFIHPHYGIETFEIVNFSRKGYIATLFEQSTEIFKENMDEGLLAFLIQLNKDYHDGKLS
ncbi:MAG: hypothetical protein P8X74_24190 [Reinekea sp.]